MQAAGHILSCAQAARRVKQTQWHPGCHRRHHAPSCVRCADAYTVAIMCTSCPFAAALRLCSTALCDMLRCAHRLPHLCPDGSIRQPADLACCESDLHTHTNPSAHHRLGVWWNSCSCLACCCCGSLRNPFHMQAWCDHWHEAGVDFKQPVNASSC